MRDSIWAARAERLLEQALDEVRSNVDAIPTVDWALAVLRIEAGERDAGEMDGVHFPGEPMPEGACICPPGLVERGGFRGGCPVHGRTLTEQED